MFAIGDKVKLKKRAIQDSFFLRASKLKLARGVLTIEEIGSNGLITVSTSRGSVFCGFRSDFVKVD